jgi:thiaminase/transcriptional activator TenA
MDFCLKLREVSERYWQGSFSHPFVLGIVDGSLELERFRMYILQDAYYLKQYVKVLALAAAKAENSEQSSYFIESARYVVEAELKLHETIVQEFGMKPAQLDCVEPSPTTYNYCNHLLQIAYQGDVSEIFAALFPCPWLYQEIGETFADAKPSVRLYQDWINMYSSQQLKETIILQKQMMNSYAEQQPHKRALYKAHFLRSCYYEWQFWQMAWTEEDWELGVGKLSLGGRL